MVGNPLDRLRYHHQVQAPRNRRRPLHHVAGKFPVQLAVEIVDVAVARNHRPGLLRLAVDERRDRIAQHLQRHRRHARQVDVGLELRLRAQIDHPAGNRHRLVAHPLQILRNLHRDRDQPELGRERGFGEQMERRVVDLNFVLVEDVVVRLHLQRERVVPLHQGPHGAGDRGFGVARHRKEALLEMGHFFVVVRHGGKGISRSDRRHRLRSARWPDW